MEGGADIPIIDVGCFFDGGADESTKRSVATQIYDALHNVGFMYIRNAKIPSPQEVEEAFALSRQFFAREVKDKELFAWTPDNIGYVAVQRERLDPTKKGDLKEAFNVNNGRQMDPWWAKHRAELAAAKAERTVEDIVGDEFLTTTAKFFNACHELACVILRIFTYSLNLPEDFFDKRLHEQAHTLRFLHYPPLDAASVETASEQTRAGEHSDYGAITLLFQDDVGGLEVRRSDDQWIEAPCIPNTILVNTGDLMQYWTNDIFRSTRHRVGIPSDKARLGRDRYSIAFFSHPNDDVDVSPLPSCVSADNPAHYPTDTPVSAGAYLQMKLGATY